ncbi:MAG TPA: bifunctional nuclease family protein [Planctomycetota bacterium]|nr:bifunctional nuclease family protein [Planctomycetota bacterium]
MTLKRCSIYQVLSCEKLGYNRVLIRPEGADVVVPIVIGSTETAAIVRGLQKEQPPRPMTHDLLVAALNQTGGLIEKIVITKLDGGTFHAQLVVKDQQGSVVEVDARPSDCMALASMTQVPIFIDDSVVDEAGVALEEK